METYEGARVELLMDSGANHSVCGRHRFPSYPLKEGGPRDSFVVRGTTISFDNGEKVNLYGDKTVDFDCEGETLKVRLTSRTSRGRLWRSRRSSAAEEELSSLRRRAVSSLPSTSRARRAHDGLGVGAGQGSSISASWC